MSKLGRPLMLITGTRKGIGRHLAEYYSQRGFQVIGCSREKSEFSSPDYVHYCLDVCDETAVLSLFRSLKNNFGRLDVLINNAGIAAMNNVLLTPRSQAEAIFSTNVLGTFLFCREAGKLMMRAKFGRIVLLTTIAVPFNLEGEALYAASKAAVEKFGRILARELGNTGITVNAVGPGPTQTDLIGGISSDKIDSLVACQAIRRRSEFSDITNVIDFFIRPESSFITGQTIYLGGV